MELLNSFKTKKNRKQKKSDIVTESSLSTRSSSFWNSSISSIDTEIDCNCPECIPRTDRNNQNSNEDRLLVKIKTSNGGIVPSSSPSGYEIYSSQDMTVKNGNIEIVETSITLDYNSDYVAKIYPKKEMVFADVNFVGGNIYPLKEIKVVLQNNSQHDFYIRKGDCIGHLIFHKIPVGVEWEIID